MELELHQLELRYEALRKHDPRRERRLIASIADVGQQMPIVVVATDGGRWVVIDGHKRVRALRRLRQDLVRATAWEVDEAEALMLERLMRASGGDDALEQGWLLRELHLRFMLPHGELARRFDKSESWVSRRVALVSELSETIQEKVRKGAICAHAAMKHLVPLARANEQAAQRIADAIGPLKLSSRQVGRLYEAWKDAPDERQRERIESNPLLYLRAWEEARRKERLPAEQIVTDLDAMGGIARRIHKRVARQGLWRRLSAPERDEARRCCAETRLCCRRLFEYIERESKDDKEADARSDS